MGGYCNGTHLDGILDCTHDSWFLDGTLGIRFGTRPKSLENVGAPEGLVTAGRSEQPGVVARFPTQSIIVCSWKQQSTERKWESVDCPWTSRSVGNEKYIRTDWWWCKIVSYMLISFITFVQITSKISYNCKTMNSACRSWLILSFSFFLLKIFEMLEGDSSTRDCYLFLDCWSNTRSPKGERDTRTTTHDLVRVWCFWVVVFKVPAKEFTLANQVSHFCLF